MDTDTHCPVCYEAYDPEQSIHRFGPSVRISWRPEYKGPCRHHICGICFYNMAKQSESQEMSCPLCREDWTEEAEIMGYWNDGFFDEEDVEEDYDDEADYDEADYDEADDDEEDDNLCVIGIWHDEYAQ